MTRPGVPRFEVVRTTSGAAAMRDLSCGEIMHPGTGPDVEPVALYVIPSRLRDRLTLPPPAGQEGDVVLLDVGLGAASNAIAAWRVSEALAPGERTRRLTIVSFENDLGSLALALSPEHAPSFGFSGATLEAARVLLEKGYYETEHTTWRLAYGDFVTMIDAEAAATSDIVFWDFYSPKTHPSLWNVSTLKALRRVCRAGCTLHTYSTATSLRAGLLLAGFAVGHGEPTGTRSETTLAEVTGTHRSALDRPLGARWLERLERSHAAFPNDVGTDAKSRASALAAVRACEQFRQ